MMSMMMTITIQTTTATAEPAMIPTGLSVGALTLFISSGSLITVGAGKRQNNHSPAATVETAAAAATAAGGGRKEEKSSVRNVGHATKIMLCHATCRKLETDPSFRHYD